MSNIFISYNPNKEIEQNTALRMQTIASLYNLSVELPSRQQMPAKAKISSETQNRIARSAVVVAISLYKMSPQLQAELQFAMQENKPIVVLYDEKKGKNIDFGAYNKVKEINIDFNNTDEALHQIAPFLKSISQQEAKNNQSEKQSAESTNENGLVIGVIAIGLGLLALWALAKSDK
jgi:hypothetical protein